MTQSCSLQDDCTSSSLVTRFADRYGFGETELLDTLARTAFRQQNGAAPSREQLLSLLAVADSYDLNPFIRQIYGLSDRQGGLLPVISVDGWIKIMNTCPQSDGMAFHYPDELTTLDGDMKPCHSWMECVIYRKDREHPVRVREYLDELYRPVPIKNGRKFPGPWQTCPKRMLRHKTQIQAIRIAYGLGGLFEPDEAERILESSPEEPVRVLEDTTVEVKSVQAGGVGENRITAGDLKDRHELDPQIVAFIDQVIDRARNTGAFTAAQGFAQERFRNDSTALNYCLQRLDEAEASLATTEAAG